MDAFLGGLSRTLLEFGPHLTFLLAFLETAWLQGFLMPTGPVMVFSAALLSQSDLPWWPVLAAGFAGGALGDSTHYLIGRWLGDRVHRAPGWIGRAAERNLPRARDLFRRHPAFAVTLARMVSFVRTLTPGVAGAAGLPYRIFLPFDLLGLLGWSVMYVGIGVLAGENWTRVSSLAGSAWMVLFLVLAAYYWRRTRRPRSRAAGAGELP